MKSLRFKYFVFAGLLLGISLVLGLWTWNTLAELFGLPNTQFKHVLAAIVSASLLRWFFLPRQPGRLDRCRGCPHEQ